MSTKSAPKLKAKAARKNSRERYVLQLFVAGISPNSIRAIENINTICAKYLKGRHELDIIDIYQQPDQALKEEIVAIPVLVRKFPLPEQRLIGDLSNTKTVLNELGLT